VNTLTSNHWCAVPLGIAALAFLAVSTAFGQMSDPVTSDPANVDAQFPSGLNPFTIKRAEAQS